MLKKYQNYFFISCYLVLLSLNCVQASNISEERMEELNSIASKINVLLIGGKGITFSSLLLMSKNDSYIPQTKGISLKKLVLSKVVRICIQSSIKKIDEKHIVVKKFNDYLHDSVVATYHISKNNINYITDFAEEAILDGVVFYISTILADDKQFEDFVAKCNDSCSW